MFTKTVGFLWRIIILKDSSLKKLNNTKRKLKNGRKIRIKLAEKY